MDTPNLYYRCLTCSHLTSHPTKAHRPVPSSRECPECGGKAVLHRSAREGEKPPKQEPGEVPVMKKGTEWNPYEGELGDAAMAPRHVMVWYCPGALHEYTISAKAPELASHFMILPTQTRS